MIRTATAAAALAALTALPAQAFDITNMSEDERAAFRAEVRAYLMDNPEVIIEAVNTLEARQAEQQVAMDAALVETNAAAIFDDGFSWVGGNPDGDITLVEFIDYRCGYCRRAHDEVEELIASDGNIRFIVKEFPILGESSTASSRFAVATLNVAGAEAYKAVHDALIALPGDATEPALRRVADTLGLDADAILAEMGSAEVTRVLNETRALAQRLQINGTPSFVLGGQMLRGYVPLEGMRQIVAAERADG